jgi:hypothetical protein
MSLNYSVSRTVALALKASCLYFSLVFGAGFLLGAVRVPFLVPRLGVRAAELLEAPLMCMVVVASARLVVKRFDVFLSNQWFSLVGSLALALMVVAELSMVTAIQHQTITQYIAGRDPVSGSVYVLLLCLFAAMPSIISRAKALRLRSPRTRT